MSPRAAAASSSPSSPCTGLSFLSASSVRRGREPRDLPFGGYDDRAAPGIVAVESTPPQSIEPVAVRAQE